MKLNVKGISLETTQVRDLATRHPSTWTEADKQLAHDAVRHLVTHWDTRAKHVADSQARKKAK